MILTAIVACEILFWVAIGSGLVARYLLRRPRLGGVLLILGPVIDAVLLGLVATDLLRGGVASWHHGLAALYIGISIAYGTRMVAWADARFAHRFAGGAAPERLSGRAYTVKCWGDVLRTTLAVVVAGALLGGLIVVVDDPVRTEALAGFFGVLVMIVAVDVVWAVSYTLWPKRPVVRTTGSA